MERSIEETKINVSYNFILTLTPMTFCLLPGSAHKDESYQIWINTSNEGR
jgi:hypothetical protein